MNIPTPIQCDFYKTGHAPWYPDGTTKLYSNLTPRKSRMKGVDGVVVFGIQYFILEYLITQWNRDFFGVTNLNNKVLITNTDQRDHVIAKYKRMMDNTLGKDMVSTKYMEELWELGYLPLEIKALPEGTICPIGVPCLTITNTHPCAYWLVNYLETILSCTIWQPMTSATIANEYRKILEKYAVETTGSSDFVQWQGHDFSMRGMSSLESACTSGAGHLLSFTGTDTVPAISFLEQYYGADVEKELVGSSVPATEHSVMCMGLKDGELATFARLLRLCPRGILSVVSDTWDLWHVIRPGGLCDQLKETILGRDGKLVIRPDSGDPERIIAGYYDTEVVPMQGADRSIVGYTVNETGKVITFEEKEGVVRLLWSVFGGKTNDHGYKELDSHIGAIYGDSITLERAKAICERLKTNGFASTNIVFGIGSYTYQYNTRDTFGFAMKTTYGEVRTWSQGNTHCSDEAREIFKAPITDSGEKRSAKGLLCVNYDEKLNLILLQQQTKEAEETGLLETVFLDGKLTKFQTLSEIRERLKSNKKNLTVLEAK